MPDDPNSGAYFVEDDIGLHTHIADDTHWDPGAAQPDSFFPLGHDKEDVAFTAIGSAHHLQPDDHGLHYQDRAAPFPDDSGVDPFNEGARSLRAVEEAYTPGYAPIDPKLLHQAGSSIEDESSEGYDFDIVGSQPSEIHSEYVPSFRVISPGDQAHLLHQRYVPILPASAVPPSGSNSAQLLQIPPMKRGRSVSTGNLQLTTRDNITHVEMAPQHICLQCGKRLKDKTGLKQHTRNKHEHPRAPTNACPQQGCSKRFLYPKDRDRHALTHGGPKIYHCHPCKKEFGRRDHFKRHLANRNIHQLSSEQVNQRLEDEEKPIRDAWSQSSTS